MTRLRFAALKNTALEADSKPSGSYNLDQKWLEQDTGRLYHHDGSAWNLRYGRDKTETFTNKSIDAETNTFENIVGNSLFVTGAKRRGSIIPACTLAESLSGALKGLSTDFKAGTTPVPAVDVTEGVYEKLEIDASARGGYSSSVIFTRRAYNPRIKIKVKSSSTTNRRFYCGFSSATPLPLSDTVLGSSDSGVIVGFNTARANFSVWNNDAGGSAIVADFGSGIAKDTTWRTFEIVMSSSDVVCKLDGANTVTLTTRIPSTTTDLYLYIIGERV